MNSIQIWRMDVKPKISNPSLYDNATAFGKLYCSWVIHFYQWFSPHSKFDSARVEIEDLPRCAAEDESELLFRKFQTNYEIVKREHKFPSFIGRFSQSWILLSLIRTFRYEALFPFLLFFLQDCILKPILPVLIGLIIRYFYQMADEECLGKEVSPYHCTVAIGSLILVATLLVATTHPSFAFAMKLSMRVKLVWSTMIYVNCLQLKAENRRLSSIVNMMTNDVRRFDEFAVLGHCLLIIPIQTGLFLTIAWHYIGSACLASFLAFLVLAYVTSRLSKHFALLRSKSIRLTEKRLDILGETFRKLRALKIYTLENRFLNRVLQARRAELDSLFTPLTGSAINLSFSMICSRVVMYISFLLYFLLAESKEFFQPETVFVSVAIFERLRYSLTLTLPQSISSLYDILASCDRLDHFLSLAKLKQTAISTATATKPKGISVRNLHTRPLHGGFQLCDISLDVHSGQTLAVIGSVGCGKTALLLTLLSEIEAGKYDRFQLNGAISYASQEVYCLNASIKENILFGRPYSPARYRQVLHVCALERDLEQLPLGDGTLVGESGFALSGGQKARISLARAVYSEADIYLLDDPFSAVDVRLANHIFHKCVQEFLHNKCVVLATHHLQFVSHCDQALLLDRGESLAYGPVENLKQDNARFREFSQTFNWQSVSINPSSDHNNSHNVKDRDLVEKLAPTKVVQLDRLRATSGICKEYWTYLREGSTGFGSIYLVAASALFTQLFAYLCDHWLTLWNQTPNGPFLTVYTLIISALVLASIGRAFTFYKLCLTASEQLHNRIVAKILHAPITLFDFVSVGKLLDNFSSDVGILDETLPAALFELSLAFVQVFSVIALVMLLNPYMCLVTFLYLATLVTARQYLVPPTQVVRKFQVQTRNRLFAHLGSTMTGLGTIRAFSAQDNFTKRFFSLLNDHTAIGFLQSSTARLLCFLVDLLSIAYISIVIIALFVSVSNSQLIGLILGSIFQLIGITQWAWKRTIDSEFWIVSCLNLASFETLPVEQEDSDVRVEWKDFSGIEFDDTSVYYNSKDSCRFVLKNVDLKMNPGEKIGVCGRSGSGKSTLINGLLRFAHHSGDIRINGNRIDAYSLADLRRHISIIPQYPVIFNCSIRGNLDLFHRHSDEELWTALDKVQMRSIVESFDGQLDTKIRDDSNLISLGHKQLICLARIVLQDNQLIILDEATANVDLHTDALIQRTIRQIFTDRTVISIAHRLDSIIDSDRILVFDDGHLVEDGCPSHLLHTESSHFAQLVKQNKAN